MDYMIVLHNFQLYLSCCAVLFGSVWFCSLLLLWYLQEIYLHWMFNQLRRSFWKMNCNFSESIEVDEFANLYLCELWIAMRIYTSDGRWTDGRGELLKCLNCIEVMLNVHSPIFNSTFAKFFLLLLNFYISYWNLCWWY